MAAHQKVLPSDSRRVARPNFRASLPELKAARVFLEFDEQTLGGLDAYCNHGKTLTESSLMAGISRQTMRWKLQQVSSVCSKLRGALNAIIDDDNGIEWLSEILINPPIKPL